MSYTVEKDGKEYDGWGTFKCSVCGKSVFIQYDSYEKPSTGRIITHKGKCYCLCDKCVNKCIVKGKAKVLKDAKDYKPTDDTEYQEPEYLKDVPTEYKSLAGFIPAVAFQILFGNAGRLSDFQNRRDRGILRNLNVCHGRHKSAPSVIYS